MDIRKQKQLFAVIIVTLCLLFLAAVSNILHASAERTANSASADRSGSADNANISGEAAGRLPEADEGEVIRASETGGRELTPLWARFKEALYRAAVPFLAFSESTLLPESAAESVFLHSCAEFPLIRYAGEQESVQVQADIDSIYAMILALEGADEDNHSYLDEIDSLTAMELENQAVRGEGTGSQELFADAGDGQGMNAEGASGALGEGSTDEGTGNLPVLGSGLVMLRTVPVFRYDMALYQDLESLVKNFYIVDSTTSVSPDRLNLDLLLQTDVTIHGDNSNPQILIYHTHSLEGFADSVPGDMLTGIVGAGEYLAALLTEQYGYNVIHHTGQYDVAVRDQAYAQAAPAIEAILEQYPSIEVVIDLHRDEVREETRLVTDIDGRPSAKFMFFNGLSYSNTLGNISYLENPHIQENLAFSFRAQVLANEYYPGLTRGIYLRAYRYNMHFVGKNMLIELGAQNNTCEEIWNTVPILAQILDMVLKGET